MRARSASGAQALRAPCAQAVAARGRSRAPWPAGGHHQGGVAAEAVRVEACRLQGVLHAGRARHAVHVAQGEIHELKAHDAVPVPHPAVELTGPYPRQRRAARSATPASAGPHISKDSLFMGELALPGHPGAQVREWCVELGKDKLSIPGRQ